MTATTLSIPTSLLVAAAKKGQSVLATIVTGHGENEVWEVATKNDRGFSVWQYDVNTLSGRMDFEIEGEARQELALRLTRRSELSFCEGCLVRLPANYAAECCGTCQAEMDALLAADEELKSLV